MLVGPILSCESRLRAVKRTLAFLAFHYFCCFEWIDYASAFLLLSQWLVSSSFSVVQFLISRPCSDAVALHISSPSQAGRFSIPGSYSSMFHSVQHLRPIGLARMLLLGVHSVVHTLSALRVVPIFPRYQ